MSDGTDYQTAAADRPRKLLDLAIPLSFAAVALVTTAVSLEAIGFTAWQPATFLVACIFD
ncbi:hypothetical protein [Bradyrhizobium sp. 62]|uniref:hypothetical protein n=1 Tax=Bradyrhizobium sp. 62 TaxID=1043588 RepID=UPI001FF7EAD9|nr:hypothetical protein [Bradyrhizobium sp. 62]MCK1368297.1 hypothetical protein [Bradyrhizobium sp. 62]